jgi:glyoxylase-like metal-dependent hydrolase (beta-lactamase superfamily II)
MLVDGGIDSADAWAALSLGVEAVTPWSDVRLHVVTHMHVDHIGLVPRVRDTRAIPLHMNVLDAARAAHAASEPEEEDEYRRDLLRTHGAPPDILERLADYATGDTSRRGFVPPDRLLPCEETEVAGAGEWRSVWTPGHTAGHISLFRARDGALIAGDAVIPKVSPTLGVNRQRADPVGDFLGSLDRIEALAPRTVYGGHGDPMAGADRAGELRVEALEEAERVEALLGEEPESAWSLAHRRYKGRDLPMYLRMLAFRETLAHLERLVTLGRASRVVLGSGRVGFAGSVGGRT